MKEANTALCFSLTSNQQPVEWIFHWLFSFAEIPATHRVA